MFFKYFIKMGFILTVARLHGCSPSSKPGSSARIICSVSRGWICIVQMGCPRTILNTYLTVKESRSSYYILIKVAWKQLILTSRDSLIDWLTLLHPPPGLASEGPDIIAIHWCHIFCKMDSQSCLEGLFMMINIGMNSGGITWHGVIKGRAQNGGTEWSTKPF